VTPHLFAFRTRSVCGCLLLLSGFVSEEGAELLAWTLPASALRGPPGSSSAKARGLNGMFSRGSVSPESHASEIRAKKGSGAVPI